MDEKTAKFESSVNSEYSKTALLVSSATVLFESSVNSEYSKTKNNYLCQS